MKRTNFDRYLDEQLKDPAFARGFEEAGKEWDLALQIARLRKAAGLSQLELAKRVGTTQQQISRLERPHYRGSLTTIQRVAEALGVSLFIQLRPQSAKVRRQSGARARKTGRPARSSR